MLQEGVYGKRGFNKIMYFAYLDPTTGSLFVQAFIGTLAGVGFIFRTSLQRAIRWALTTARQEKVKNEQDNDQNQ